MQAADAATAKGEEVQNNPHLLKKNAKRIVAKLRTRQNANWDPANFPLQPCFLMFAFRCFVFW
jgi:hypothetical protein